MAQYQPHWRGAVSAALAWRSISVGAILASAWLRVLSLLLLVGAFFKRVCSGHMAAPARYTFGALASSLSCRGARGA